MPANNPETIELVAVKLAAEEWEGSGDDDDFAFWEAIWLITDGHKLSYSELQTAMELAAQKAIERGQALKDLLERERERDDLAECQSQYDRKET